MKRHMGKILSLSLAAAMTLTSVPAMASDGTTDMPAVISDDPTDGQGGTGSGNITGEEDGDGSGEIEGEEPDSEEEETTEVGEIASADDFQNLEAGKNYVLTASLTISGSDAIKIPANVTIDGQNHTITIDGENWETPYENAITIEGDGVTLKNLVLDGNKADISGIHVYNCEEVTLENIQIHDFARAGIIVNSAEVTATGIQTSGNVWGAVNVDAKVDGNEASLTMEESTMEEAVQIYTEKPSEATVTVDGMTAVIGVGDDLKGFTYYTDDVSKLGVATVETEEGVTVYQTMDNLPESGLTGTMTLVQSLEEPYLLTGATDLTITAAEDVTIPAMTVLNSNDVTFQGITFNGADSTLNLDTNPAALYVQNSSAITVDGCVFVGDAVEGTAAAITTAAGVEGFEVKNSQIQDYVMSAYHNGGGKDISYVDNTFENIQSGIAFDGTENVTVEGNTFTNANGIRLRPNGDTLCSNVTVSENNFESMNTDSPYGTYAVMTKTADVGDTSGTNGVESVDLSGNYWGTTDPEAINAMITSNEGQTIRIDTIYESVEDLEQGQETVVTQNTGIKINGTWYQTEEEIAGLADALTAIADGATVEVYGEVGLPFDSSLSGVENVVDGFFVIDADNVTIKGMTANATLYGTGVTTNGNWGSQSLLLLTGENVTVENLTIMPQAQDESGTTNKTIEFAGKNPTIRNCTIMPNTMNTPNTVDGASVYFNGSSEDMGTITVEGCKLVQSGICFDSVTTADEISITGNTFDGAKASYVIGNNSWDNPAATTMADVAISGNTFQNIPEDTKIVLQRMNGNFIIGDDNTLPDGRDWADAIGFAQWSGGPELSENMKISLIENGQTTVYTPNTTTGEPDVALTFSINPATARVRVNRDVELTAEQTGVEGADLSSVKWYVNGEDTGETGESYTFSQSSRGTYEVTAEWVNDGNTYTATATVTVTRPSSSSSGGSSPTYTPSGKVDVEKVENGDVTLSDDRAEEGDRVTITVEPDKGFVVDEIIVEDEDGNEITVRDGDEENEYTFRMPAGDVSVLVTFKEAEDETGNEEETTDTPVAVLPFTDVAESDWFFDAVDYVYDEGLMSGTDGITFSPNVNTTRGMIVSILYRMEGSPAMTATAPFLDVTADQYYAPAVAWASSNGIVSGYDAQTFGPNDNITREQMASILQRYAQYKGLDVTASGNLSAFIDAANVSGWATDSVSWAVDQGLISGRGDGILAPQANATRAEVASILMRYSQMLEN